LPEDQKKVRNENALHCSEDQIKKYHGCYLSSMSLDSILVSSVMTPNVLTDTEEQNIMSACRIMYENNIGCVIIVKLTGSKEPVGIITERDIVRILGKFDPHLLQTPLRSLMSKPLVTIENTATINDAMKIIVSKDIRRLVIKSHNKMVGIVTDKDIFKLITRTPELLTESYNHTFPLRSSEMTERFTEYYFNNLRPDL
jgi:CBS domain-containing protein